METQSFDHISDTNSKIIIIGTIPGKESLKSGQYYNHPNNLFWDIIYRVCYPEWPQNKVVNDSYDLKKKMLIDNRIALWDVLKFCDRKESSLDKHIRNQIHNDFDSFFSEYKNIKAVFFNGQKAAHFFNDFKNNSHIFENRDFFTLQSTSPSNKTNSFRILNQWLQIRDHINIHKS